MRGEWGVPRARAGEPRVPKREGAIDPINPRGEPACSLCPRAKIEHCQFNSRLFDTVFSGINRAWRSSGPGIFSYFILQIYVATLFERANKIMITVMDHSMSHP